MPIMGRIIPMIRGDLTSIWTERSASSRKRVRTLIRDKALRMAQNWDNSGEAFPVCSLSEQSLESVADEDPSHRAIEGWNR